MHTAVHCLFDRERLVRWYLLKPSVKFICDLWECRHFLRQSLPQHLTQGGPNQSLFITNFLKQSIKMSGKSKEQQLPDI